MTVTTSLLEPSFVDLIVAIGQAHATGAVPRDHAPIKADVSARLAVAVRFDLNF